MSSVHSGGGHEEGRVGRAPGNAVCIIPAGLARPQLQRRLTASEHLEHL